MTLAKYRPYTLDVAPVTTYPDAETPKLTDNRVARANVSAYAWVGFDSEVVVEIDLGSSYLVKRCRALIGRFSASNIEPPASLSFELGAAGTFTSFGSLSPSIPDESATYVFTDDNDGVEGDTLRVTMTPQTSKRMLIAELQAWDTQQPQLFDLPEDYIDSTILKPTPVLAQPKRLRSFAIAGLLSVALGAFNSGSTLLKKMPKLARPKRLTSYVASSLVSVQVGGASITNKTITLIDGRLKANVALSKAAGLILIATDDDGRPIAFEERLSAASVHEFDIAVARHYESLEIHLEVSDG